MLAVSGRSTRTLLFSVVTVVALCTTPQIVRAEDPTMSDEILNALTQTRGLTVAPLSPAQATEQVNFIQSVKDKTAGSLSVDERQKIATVAKTKPSIDVRINFELGSDKIGPAAAQAIKEVAKALANAQLSGNTFVIAGHTDAKGGEAYNQELSERRAEAVKRELTAKYGIPAQAVVSVGYGKTMLKDTADPFSGENRRVQIVNMSDKNVAAR